MTENILSGLGELNQKGSRMLLPYAYAQAQKILEYLDQHTRLVLKPIGLFGAKGVNCLQKNQQNTMETINQLTHNECNLVVCQKFLPEVYVGDKRIFMIHGEIAGAFTTIPQNGDFRADDSFGAVSMESTITDQEMALCHAIQPKLKEDHLYCSKFSTFKI